MIKLIKNADVYAPEHLGKRDILICGEKISAVADHLDVSINGEMVEVIDMKGAKVGPGYIMDMFISPAVVVSRDLHPVFLRVVYRKLSAAV